MGNAYCCRYNIHLRKMKVNAYKTIILPVVRCSCSGPGSSSGKALGHRLDGPGSILGIGGGVDFSSNRYNC